MKAERSGWAPSPEAGAGDVAAKQPKAPKSTWSPKVEKTAELLNKLPNKSALHPQGHRGALGRAPLCQGRGGPRGVHDHYAPLLSQISHRNCEGCGHDLPLPREPGELDDESRDRLEQFFLGGPLYCDGCYEKAPSCTDCGWHIAPERTADHLRQAHRGERY
jgi:hypothetical protein